MGAVRIYGIVDPRCGEVRYVGKTAGTLEGRLAGHYRDARRKKRTPVRAWLLKLESLGLRSQISMIVLEDQPLDWYAAERRWIAHYRRLYPGRMKNVTDGGEGGRTKPGYSADDRVGLSERAKQGWQDPDTRAKQLAARARARTDPVVLENLRLGRERRKAAIAAMTPAELEELRARRSAAGRKAGKASGVSRQIPVQNREAMV